MLVASLVVVAGCGKFARSGSTPPSTTPATFGALPPLEALTAQLSTSTSAGKPGAGPATTAKPGARTTTTAARAATAPAPPPAPAQGSQSAIDARPCENPTDRHAVERTDPGGLFLRIGAAKNCVARTDKIEIVVQVGNPGKTTLYLSSTTKPLVSLIGAGGTAAWSSPCEVKPPPPGSPPDVPIAIEPGKSVEVARVTYERATSECGDLGVGRYDGQASVAQCTSDDAADGVCNSPKRIPTERVGVEIKA